MAQQPYSPPSFVCPNWWPHFNESCSMVTMATVAMATVTMATNSSVIVTNSHCHITMTALSTTSGCHGNHFDLTIIASMTYNSINSTMLTLAATIGYHGNHFGILCSRNLLLWIYNFYPTLITYEFRPNEVKCSFHFAPNHFSDT